jgi:hypothetical protein
MREFLRSGPHIDALWAANDPMALGAIAALKEAGYRPGVDVMVGGLNWSQAAVDRVLKHEMVVTYGGHFLLGAWAMVVLRDYKDGGDFAEEDVRLHFPMGAFDLPMVRLDPTPRSGTLRDPGRRAYCSRITMHLSYRGIKIARA